MVIASPGTGAMAPDSATANIAMLDVRKQQVAAMQRAVSPGAQRMMDYREEHVTPRSPNGSIYARAQSPGRTRFECDYDSNPTELYLAIQRKDWRGAEAAVDSDPHEFIGDTHVAHAKTSDKSDQDERIRLQKQIIELKEELKQTKKRSKYDLDDVNRVNASLRRDLEKANSTNTALNDELDLRYEEFETLQEDMEKFAETFASQHEELQRVQGRVKKLTFENEELKLSDKGKSDKIINLAAQLELLKSEQSSKAPEWVGDEIGKLWNEISRMKKEEMESTAEQS